ncbi:hypothetical protein [Clostridium grantii]|uniref:Uncharacterized protein n=1 Tax=Clostridium grantii DSM 8605 TaxID=1121316 RepID=A0A1M5RTY5_9CLOT|nr:hypothetical protein [Clostridium grantii]SHH29775.1 hypothetical protein SAMN02745207_00723 [Clostridium grantii DSM 8605]
MPDIAITEPVAQEKFMYNYYLVDGIHIYIRKIFSLKETISFSLSSLVFLKEITVHGIKIL